MKHPWCMSPRLLSGSIVDIGAGADWERNKSSQRQGSKFDGIPVGPFFRGGWVRREILACLGVEKESLWGLGGGEGIGGIFRLKGGGERCPGRGPRGRRGWSRHRKAPMPSLPPSATPPGHPPRIRETDLSETYTKIKTKQYEHLSHRIASNFIASNF